MRFITPCFTSAVVVIAGTLIGASSASASIVVNGSFESGTQSNTIAVDIPGWVIGGNGVERFQPTDPSVNFGPAPDGSWVLDLAFYTSGNGRISQILTTVPNAYYDLTFSLGNSMAFGRDGTGVIDVFIDGSPHTFNTPVATSSAAVWAPEVITFQAQGPTTTVEFADTQDPTAHFGLLDDVNVSESQSQGGSGGAIAHLPEPASLVAWSTLGLLGAVMSVWRKR